MARFLADVEYTFIKIFIFFFGLIQCNTVFNTNNLRYDLIFNYFKKYFFFIAMMFYNQMNGFNL